LNDFLDVKKTNCELSQLLKKKLKTYSPEISSIKITYKYKGIHNFEITMRMIETIENQKFVAKSGISKHNKIEQRNNNKNDARLTSLL
jgi:hypothetical protein